MSVLHKKVTDIQNFPTFYQSENNNFLGKITLSSLKALLNCIVLICPLFQTSYTNLSEIEK